MEMGGTKHEPGVGADVGVLGNEGARVAPLPKPRHVLDADGYLVQLCPFCHGFGFLTQMNDRMDDYEDTICTNCKGTGRYMIRFEPKRLEFFKK